MNWSGVRVPPDPPRGISLEAKLKVSNLSSPVRFRYSAPILCSSAVEPTTVNRLVAGSNPAGGVSSNSSAVEHLLYTEIVGGSIPSSSISIFYYVTTARDQT